MKIGAHKRLFKALGTVVLRKFGHWPISHKVRRNTAYVLSLLYSVIFTSYFSGL